MAQVTINLPALPKDWKTTVTGLSSAIGIAVEDYIQTGHVTARGAVVAGAIAVIGYLVPDKTKAKDLERAVDVLTEEKPDA